MNELIEMLYEFHTELDIRLAKVKKQFDALRDVHFSLYLTLHELWLYVTPGPHPGLDIPAAIKRAKAKIKELDKKFKMMGVD